MKTGTGHQGPQKTNPRTFRGRHSVPAVFQGGAALSAPPLAYVEFALLGEASTRGPLIATAAQVLAAVADPAAAVDEIMEAFFARRPHSVPASLPGEAMRANYGATLKATPACVPGATTGTRSAAPTNERPSEYGARAMDECRIVVDVLREAVLRSRNLLRPVNRAAVRIECLAFRDPDAARACAMRSWSSKLGDACRAAGAKTPAPTPEQRSKDRILEKHVMSGGSIAGANDVQRYCAEYDSLIAAGARLRMSRERYVEMNMTSTPRS